MIHLEKKLKNLIQTPQIIYKKKIVTIIYTHLNYKKKWER